jgi:hypothetical protein
MAGPGGAPFPPGMGPGADQQRTMMAGVGGAPMSPMTPMPQQPYPQQPQYPQQQYGQQQPYPQQQQPYPQQQQPYPQQPQGPVGQRPQYLASQSAARDMSPTEPWAGTLRLMMILFGIALLVTFAGPSRIGDGGMDFMWKQLTSGGFSTAKLWPLYFGVGGLITLLFGLLPVPTAARGVVAALVGISPIVMTMAFGGMGPSAVPFRGWQAYMMFGGLVLGSTGLLLRSRYRGAFLGRLLATIGCGAICALFLIPEGGDIPLIQMFKMLGGGGGLGFAVIWMLVLFVAAALGLIMSWLPSGTSGGTGLFAWLLILWPFGLILFGGIIDPIIRGMDIGALLKTPFILYSVIDTLAFSALAAYGLATIFGKSLEA